MLIKINGNEVEWSAPGVFTLGEVTGAIKDWLKQQGWRWRSALLDGSEYVESLEERLLESAACLEVLADHQTSQILEHLDLLHGFIDLAVRGSESRPETFFDQIKEVWTELEPMLPQVFGLPLGPRERAVLESLKEAMPKGWDGLSNIKGDLDRLLARLEQMETLILLPKESLVHLKKRLGDHLPVAVEIPVKYQSGKEREASADFLETLDIIDLIFLWYQFAAPVGELPPEALEAAHFLRQLEKALAKADWILSGDLLEYEILPRLTKIAESDTLAPTTEPHETSDT